MSNSNENSDAANLNIVSSSSASSVSEGGGSHSASSSPKASSGPPTSVQLPAIAAPSPVTTKASKALVEKTPKQTSSNKPLTVTVNGNDRSKDLNEHDVVCEKGRGDHERWPGNKLYRHLININKETYNDLAPIERSNIIGKIIGTIQEKEGWFVSHSETTGTWAKLTEEKVRKKVSDDLRREVRRRREKRSNSSLFSAKLRAIKEMEEVEAASRDIIERVDDPRQNDVLFGPGARRHPGNKVYWHHMKLNLDQYIISPYGARSVIARNIVQIIRSQHGRFLEQDPKTGLWYSISDKRALEKTSHALSNMKYKTRKRHPDEPPFPVYGHPQHAVVPHGFVHSPYGHPHMPHLPPHHPHHPHAPHHHPMHPHHHLASYRMGALYGSSTIAAEETMGMYGDEDDDVYGQEKIMEGDSPNTIFAKNRTKKFRLLNRMDDVVVQGNSDQTPLKGGRNESSTNTSQEDVPAEDRSTLRSETATPKTVVAEDLSTGANATPSVSHPLKRPVSSGKIISPNSSSTSDTSGLEYQEQRNPNAYHNMSANTSRRIVQHLPPSSNMPPGADSFPPESSHHSIAPRISHFDYVKEYGGHLPTASTPFHKLSHAARMRGDEYSSVAPTPPSANSTEGSRRTAYLAPSLVAVATQEAAARRWAAAASAGGGQPPSEYY